VTSEPLARADDTLWRAIADRGTTVHRAAGSPLLHHGEVGTHCYAILAGEVLVSTTTSQGATVVLGRRGPGAVIGEFAALDAAPRSATATARTDVTAVALTAHQFETLLRDRPELAIGELRRLSRQLRNLSERYTVRNEELRARLANLLLTHRDETGETTLHSTRQELADWVGATREAVTRSLRALEDQGMVELGRRTVTLVDPTRLARLATA
jgi:CRP-like cAMP-binding protein